MQIKQEVPAFKPITIQLNTREEADAFWGILCAVEKIVEPESQKMAIKLSNWFTNTAKL
jgi:hypothetical protein